MGVPGTILRSFDSLLLFTGEANDGASDTGEGIVVCTSDEGVIVRTSEGGEGEEVRTSDGASIGFSEDADNVIIPAGIISEDDDVFSEEG